MKPFKLGSTICVLGGIVLFGTTGTQPSQAAVAPASVVAPADDAGGAASPAADPAWGPTAASIAPASPAARGPVEALADGTCPSGMIEVKGDYCPWLEQKCVRWLDPETKMRCAEFAPTAGCQARTIAKHFCIDAYEYPNQPGERPVVMKTWYQARSTCEGLGKRLCNETEWTVACEGQEHLPYPYGYERSSEACNIDKPHPEPDEKAIANPATRDAEVARLWQGEPSGTREACVSPYGVHDMTGNVDEWVVNESGRPYKSALKGGYWGPVRDRCRPSTVAHNEEFSFYQIGFRCCSDPAGASVTHGGKGGAGPALGGRPGAGSAASNRAPLAGS